MLILILIDVQYSQKAVLSFKKGLNHQNHSSGSLLLLPLFGKPCYIDICFAYTYYVSILSMYIMHVYYIFRLYRYTMYVYYGRVDAAIVQIFNFLDIHS